MAINFDSFTEGTTSNIQSNDYVVGFDTAVPGGERKWTVSTLANAVSGLIQQEILNKAMTTIGNYPYLEYAWVTAPNTSQQTITENTSAVLTLNSEIEDDSGLGSLVSNQITIPSGTYRYIISTAICTLPGSQTIFGIVKTSNNSFIRRRRFLGDFSATGYQDLRGMNLVDEGSFKITSSTTISLGILSNSNASIGSNPNPGGSVYGSFSFTLGTLAMQGADQRTTIKLWKVG